MKKTIQDDYIVAFLKDGGDDAEYEATKNVFDNVPTPDKNKIWMMRVDGTMELVSLPETEEDIGDDDVVSELSELMGVL